MKVLDENIYLAVIQTALEAGQKILKVYDSDDFDVEYKADKSPLTTADRLSHEAIVAGLESLDVAYPILSEEGQHLAYADRKNWERFWLVDPLDGTKEFIKRNGEFTVNIALVEDGIPIVGVIYAPVLDTLYIGIKDEGAFKCDCVSEKTLDSYSTLEDMSEKLPQERADNSIEVVASRSHLSEETEAFIERLKREHPEQKVRTTSAGSSLKLCLVAEGKADFYPRYAPTMEWDTAAGHAIALAAGGTVARYDNGEPLTYNKEDLLNPWFLVTSKLNLF